MKKNTMLRIASILLVVTLLSTCVISGTFAKYITKAEGEDQARVAKWGVLVSIEGNAFATEYQAHDQSYIDAGGEISVKAENDEQVVAPGTSSDDLEQTLKASVVGKPEVAARYIITASDIKDVVLKKGTYTDYTELVKAADGTYGYTKTFTLDKDYSPIKWDMKITKGSTSVKVSELLISKLPAQYLTLAQNYGLSDKGCSLTDAITIIKKVAGNDNYVEIVGNALGEVVHDGRNFQLDVTDDGDITLSYDFDPNKEMGFTFELVWSWAFSDAAEETEVTLNDKADTFLGNWAAVKLGQTIEGFVAPDNGSSIEVGASFVATAVQID